MRVTAARGVIHRRRRHAPVALLVVACGSDRITSAIDLLSAPLAPDARIVAAKYEDTSQGFVLLMSLTIVGGFAALRRVTALLRRAAEANEMAVLMWPMSKDGGLP